MALSVRRIGYFYLSVPDRPGEAYKLLSLLADRGINLLAFTAVPVGEARTQLSIVPEDADRLTVEARHVGLTLDGPHPALLVQGDDELGALAELHRKLYQANVNVFAASGLAGGHGDLAYLIYVRPEQFNIAAETLAA